MVVRVFAVGNHDMDALVCIMYLRQTYLITPRLPYRIGRTGRMQWRCGHVAGVLLAMW